MTAKHLKPSIYDAVFIGEIQFVPYNTLKTNGLAQVRGDIEDDYKDIEELALNIAQFSMFSAPSAVCYATREEAIAFIQRIANMFGDTKTIDDCVPNADGSYTFPLAGRRRLKAALRILGNPAKFYEEYRETPEECVAYVLANGQCTCKVYPSRTPHHMAISIMLAENITQRRPPTFKEIYATQKLWALTKENEVDITLKGFAKRIGFSVSTIRNIIRYVELPEEIRQMTESALEKTVSGRTRKAKPLLSKSKAFMLAGLQVAMRRAVTGSGDERRLRWTEEEITLNLLTHATLGRSSSNVAFATYIRPFVQQAYGQGELFEEFALVAQDTAAFTVTRRQAETARDFLTVLKAINFGIGKGYLDKADMIKYALNDEKVLGYLLNGTIDCQGGINEYLLRIGHPRAETGEALTALNAQILPEVFEP